MVLRLPAVDRSLCASSATTDLARLLHDSAAYGRQGVSYRVLGLHGQRQEAYSPPVVPMATGFGDL